MSTKNIIAIDQGTTGSTVLMIDFNEPKNPQIVGKSTTDFPQHFPQSGWVEHDLDEIWRSITTSLNSVFTKKSKAQEKFTIAGIGITNQRETLCVFEKGTGKPLCRAIVWQCKRSEAICHELKEKGLEPLFRKKTGLLLDPYFTGTKLTWLLRENNDVAKALKEGSALIGTIDSWLLYRLTGGAVHATDPSNASRTLMFNILTKEWDQELLNHLEVPRLVLPEIKDSSGIFGYTKGCDELPDGIPISGILGDQQAALAGQTCFQIGEAKCTYGTGAFVLTNTGQVPKFSNQGLLTTVAWSIQGEYTYALEGSSFIAGAAVQFIRDQLGLIVHSEEASRIDPKATASPEIYFVPALAGLGAPWWNPKAKGAFLGLTRGTSKEQLIRATLEGIAFQVYDLLIAMQKDFGENISVLRVDGGASGNPQLMQFQADLLNIVVDRPKNIETTALGAAMFAALGVNIFKHLDELRHARTKDHDFIGEMTDSQRATHLKGWKRAINAITLFSEVD
jgi:glycerol kinase